MAQAMIVSNWLWWTFDGVELASYVGALMSLNWVSYIDRLLDLLLDLTIILALFHRIRFVVQWTSLAFGREIVPNRGLYNSF